MDNSEARQMGRNYPCPCGSGKKYKHCCIGNPEPNKPSGAQEIAALLRGAARLPCSLCGPNPMARYHASSAFVPAALLVARLRAMADSLILYSSCGQCCAPSSSGTIRRD